LRVGELVGLQVTDIDLAKHEIVFYRAKVAKTQRHALSKDSYKALKAYISSGDAPAMGPILRKSLKGGALGDAGITELGVNLRVAQLGERVGVKGLGPHDCRHYWATKAIRKGTDPFALMQAGGWTSMQTVRKYVEENVIANAGVDSDD
jgi:integrase